MDERVRALEEWRSTQDMHHAVRIERDKNMNERFDRLEKSINEIKSHLTKIVWVIIVGILGAFLSFVTQGGLNVIQ